MADRIVIMKAGRIVQIGTPDEVYFDSTNVFVAGFIGTPATNFLEVELKREKGETFLVHPSFSFKLNDKLLTYLKDYNKNRLIMGIRPESIRINSGNAVFREKVLVVEPQGSHQIVAIELNGKIIKIVAPSFPKYSPDETIDISFDEERIMFFDIETEERLKIK